MYRYLWIKDGRNSWVFDFLEEDILDLYEKVDIRFWKEINLACREGYSSVENYRFMGLDFI